LGRSGSVDERLGRGVNFGEFTEDSYLRLIGLAQRRYAFETFGSTQTRPHVLWRHDVDVSMHRAGAMARLESERGVKATYFLLLHSPFYNLFESNIRRLARELVGLGHLIGLHFQRSYYESDDMAQLPAWISIERQLLQDLVEAPVGALSFHNPVDEGVVGVDDDEVGGLVNAYGKGLKSRYRYVSDSNGFWTRDQLPELLEEGQDDRLHVLIHPEWWTPEPMSPRERISRAIQGRANHAHVYYDELLARGKRPNVR
jgi:hypothetical protein